MDPTATKYNVYVSVQMPRQEIISDMANMLHVRSGFRRFVWAFAHHPAEGY